MCVCVKQPQDCEELALVVCITLVVLNLNRILGLTIMGNYVWDSLMRGYLLLESNIN